MPVFSFTGYRRSLRQNNWVTLSRIAQYYALVAALAQQFLVWLAELPFQLDCVFKARSTTGEPRRTFSA